MNTIISLSLVTIFVVTTFLVLVNLLENLNEIRYLRIFKIREDHLKKLFVVLILEVIVALIPYGLSTVKKSSNEYSYSANHFITRDETEIFYKKPFKYVPHLVVEDSGQGRVSVIEQRPDGFKVKAYGVAGEFKIYYFVQGVVE